MLRGKYGAIRMAELNRKAKYDDSAYDVKFFLNFVCY